MKKITFGFNCGDFSVAFSGNDLVMPGSKKQPLRYSLIRCADPNDAAGIYTLNVKCDGKIVCDLPVHVMWATHETQPEPFLGLKAENSKELREALQVYVGKSVDLTFTPKQNA